MRNKLSRVLAMILAATMTVNTLPMSVFATAPESPSQNPPVEDEFNEQEDDELNDDEVVHPEGTIENEDGTFTYPDGTIHDAEGNLIEEEEEIESSLEPTVSEVIEVSDITLDETVLEVGVGELPMILTATVWPEDATDKTITWRSSDPGVVSVDENGELTFGYMGEAVITATAGEFSAECVVTVGEGDAVAYDVPEDFVDAAIMFSDLHSMYSGTNDEGSKGYKKDVVTNMMNVFKDTGLPFSSAISCGDVFSSNESQYIGYTDTITGYIQNVLGDIPLEYVWSDHDRGAYNNATAKVPLDKTSYVAYGAGADGKVGTSDDGEYYVYALSMADLCSYDRYRAGFNYTQSSNNRAANGFTETVPLAISQFEADAALMHKDRPLLIASHQPLFDNRDDNAWAEDWFNAINKVAEGMDVVFFYGHNHKYNEADGSDYYYAKGSTMNVATRTLSDGSAWNYDYQTGSGYSYNKDLKSVEKKDINFTHVCAGYLNPSTTGTQNNTVRQGTALAVAIYDDRIKLTTYDASGVYDGNYALAVSVPLEHTVAQEPEVPEVPENPVIEQVVVEGVAGEVIKAEVTAEDKAILDAKVAEYAYEAYVAVDISAELAEGEKATVTLPIPAAWLAEASRIVGISIEDGVLKEIPGTVNEDNTFSFEVDHFSGKGAALVAEGVTGTGNLANGSVSYVLDTDGIDVGEQYIIVGSSNNYALTWDGSSIGDVAVTVDGDTVTVDEPSVCEFYFVANNSAENNTYLLTKNGTNTVYHSGGDMYYGNDNKGYWYVKNVSNGEYQVYDYDNTNWFLNYGYVWGSQSADRFAVSSTERTVRLFKHVAEPGTGVTFSVDQPSLSLLTGATGTLIPSIVLSNSAAVNNTTIVWGTNDASIATVENGVITAVAAGNTTITATLSQVNGTNLQESIVLTIPVTVTERTAKLVILNKYEGTVERDSAMTTETGAYLSVYWEDDITPVQVPVTWGMLSGDFDVTKNGTYTGLSVNYAGHVIENFTLKVVNKISVDDQLVDDFPTYPNPGSVDVKKSATGVDFQNTGLARVELSTSGLPYADGVDVIVMLDTSSSMDRCVKCGEYTGRHSDGKGENCKCRDSINRIEELKVALQTLEDTLQASPNVSNIKIAITDFNGVVGGATALDTNDRTKDVAALNSNATVKVYTNSNSNQLDENAFIPASELDVSTFNLFGYTGTNYDYAFDAIYRLGTAIKAANGEDQRPLIVIFMSDGAPNQFNYYGTTGGGSGTKDDWNIWLQGLVGKDYVHMDGTTYSESMNQVVDCADHSYYYDDVDYDGDGYVNEHRMANAIKGDPSETYKVIRKTAGLGTATSQTNIYEVPGLGATMYSLAFYVTNDGNITEKSAKHALSQTASEDAENPGEKLYVDASSGSELQNAFNVIGTKIAYAASNARYVDQMGDSFNLQLNPFIKTNNQNTSVDEGGYATTNTDITITTRPVYTQEDFVAGDCEKDDIGKPYGNGTPVETVSFVAGEKNHALTKVVTNAGGYTLPNGTTVEAGTTDIMLKGVIYGKNFFYNNNNTAVTVTLANGSTYSLPGETFYWNIGTISEVQYTMSYTVYLEGALEGIPPADSYQTNNFAILYYTNHVGNEVSKSVASPTMAWEGANVSYAFYLVNDAGQPVHADGTGAQNFLQAHKLTQPVVYQSIKLNSDGVTVAALNAIANAVLPEGYELYAPNAAYHVEVGSGNQQNANPSYWQITNDPNQTTYVMGFGDANDYSKVQLVKATYSQEYASYDYTHTIVYFAVKWVIGAVQDTVVIDYGLPVEINVLTNDMFGNAGTLSAVGLRTAKPEDYGTTLASGFGNSVLGAFGTAEIKDGKIRYKLKDKNMVMNHAETLAYAVDYDVDSTAKGFYYGDLTIIPATTIYFEDEYVTLKTYTRQMTQKEDGTTGYTAYETTPGWPTNSKDANGVQAEDRPGSFNLSTIDANNNYGYDQAYDQMSTYSMGNSAMIHVDAFQYGTAEFKFWGTGFDVISATSNETGTLVVQVYDANNKLVELDGKKLSNAVDTYYGYTYGLYTVTYEKINGRWTLVNVGEPAPKGAEALTKEQITSGTPVNGTISGYQYVWKPVNNKPNALYQVPVIQYSGLPYAQYKVKITATYYSAFDSTAEAGYDLYLDAIRIYDPAGTTYDTKDKDGNIVNGNIDDVIQDAYLADGEAWPSYRELRDMIISVDDFNCLPENSTESVSGIVFIDGATSTGAGNLTGDVGPAGDQITGKTPQISDYFNYGPNNELYLASGQAVAFTMNLGSANDHTGYVPVVHIGMKTVGSKKAVAELWNADQAGNRYNAISNDLETATDMYYDITVLNGTTTNNKTVVIKNSGAEGSILSITNIKLAYKATTMVTTPPASGGSEQQTLMFSISRSAANAALLSLQTTEETIPEDTEPETPPTEPETDSETKPTEPESKPEVKPEKPAKADNSELKSAVDAVKKLKEKDYTKESYEEFKAALKEAEKVLKDKKATQKQIDEVLVKLNDAVEALEVKAPATKPAKPAKPSESAKPETTDNSELKSVVEAAKKLKEKDFTKESYGEFKATLKDVEKVLNDKNATPTQIYEALVELNDAVEALETKPTASEESKPKQEKENADKPVEDENSEQFERPAASAVDGLLAKLKNAIEWLLELLFGWLN